MPLSPPTSRVAPTCTRKNQIQSYAHDDGLWDMDAHAARAKSQGKGPAAKPADSPRLNHCIVNVLPVFLSSVGINPCSVFSPRSQATPSTYQRYQQFTNLKLIRGLGHAAEGIVLSAERRSDTNGRGQSTSNRVRRAHANNVLHSGDAAEQKTQHHNPFRADPQSTFVTTVNWSRNTILAGPSNRHKQSHININPVHF